MRTFRQKLHDFNSVGSGQRASINLDVGGVGTGPTYSALYLRVLHNGIAMTQALMQTHIEEIKLVLVRDLGGGANERITVYDSLTATDLQAYYNDLGYPLIDGYLPFFFRRPEFGVDEIAEDHFELGTMDVRSAVLEIKFDGTVVSPELALWADIRRGVSKTMGQVITLSSNTYEAQAAAGTRQIRDLPVQGQKGLKSLFLTTDNLDEHSIVVNSIPAHDELPVDLNDFMADVAAFNTGGRVPQAGYHKIDLAGNRYSDIWDMRSVSTFELELEFNAAEAEFRIIREEVVGDRVLPGAR